MADLPDLLEQAGITWRIYQNPNDNWNGVMHGCLAFDSFRKAEPGSALYENGMRHHTLESLAEDVKNDALPQVSWILPWPSVSEHPDGGGSPIQGANFIAQILDALTANPEVWSKTAFFITFDENDGQFDHLPPPAVPSYDAHGNLMGKSTVGLDGEYFFDPGRKYLDSTDTISGTVRPWGLGPRVPMYVISPWSKGGWVCSEVFDHTSMGRFLEKRFDIRVDSISPWHRAVCGDLTSAFDFKTPNDPALPALPDSSNYAEIEASQRQKPRANPPAVPQPLFQESGTRYSRALPYELYVSAQVCADGIVTLQFANTGSTGAVFHVYDKLHLDRIPRRYTVEAGKTLDDLWETIGDDGAYDLWVYSTNGFVRVFSGNALLHDTSSVRPEIEVCYDLAQGGVVLKASNSGTQDLVLEIRANAYRQDGPWTLIVPARKTLQQAWPLADSGNWYDFTVLSNAFERRFAGRVETGRHGISDPAFGQVA